MTNILKFDEFINESRIPIAWAKPSQLTTKILSFIDEKQKVSKKELIEFLESVPEDASGKKPNISWVRNHKKYVKYKIQEEDANYYSLTPLGKRVLKSSKINETTEGNQTKIIK
jgi:DNA-binding PadR family transcriptional regulator